MLTITDINEFRSKVAHKEEIRESAIGDSSRTFCYMISDEDTFDDPLSRECRGIVFNQNGRVCGRSLHKFFNVNERESTRAENLDWSKVVRVMSKRDGSMIHTVIEQRCTEAGLMTRVFLKSKKSSESDVAMAASQHVLNISVEQSSQLNISGLIDVMAAFDCTAIFEYTAPDARIVLFYPEEELQLLHIRDNQSGRYWSLDDLRAIGKIYNVKIVEEVTEFWGATFSPGDGRYLKVDALLEAAKTRENIEGWVIQFEDGEMVKLKTEWYLKRHRAMTFLRERDIAALVLAEQLDDLKALLVGDGINIAEILNIENSVVEDILNLEHAVTSIAAPEDFSIPRKDFVAKYRIIANEYFGLLMDLYSKKQPDYKYFFKKNLFKKNFGLRQLNLFPSKAEAD